MVDNDYIDQDSFLDQTDNNLHEKIQVAIKSQKYRIHYAGPSNLDAADNDDKPSSSLGSDINVSTSGFSREKRVASSISIQYPGNSFDSVNSDYVVGIEWSASEASEKHADDSLVPKEASQGEFFQADDSHYCASEQYFSPKNFGCSNSRPLPQEILMNTTFEENGKDTSTFLSAWKLSHLDSISAQQMSTEQQGNEPMTVGEENTLNSLVPVEVSQGEFFLTVDNQYDTFEQRFSPMNSGSCDLGPDAKEILKNADFGADGNETLDRFDGRKLSHLDSMMVGQMSTEGVGNVPIARKANNGNKIRNSSFLMPHTVDISGMEMVNKGVPLGDIQSVSVSGPSGTQTQAQKAGKGKSPVCDFCGKAFAYISHLQAHRITHTEEKPFVCNKCSKGFKWKANLKSHLQTHTGEKSFKCPDCDMEFGQKYNLNRHAMTHTGKKLFNCDQCSKRFAQKVHLTNHLRTHTGEKPYVCEKCGKRFALKQVFTNHLRTHTKETPFECEFCDRKFAHPSSYYKHRKQPHDKK